MTLDGKSLENAVSLIEDHILSSIERDKIGSIKIEKNKIINADGVRHEIDVFVTIDLKIGNPFLYIFECKNWQKAISKNDIIIFTEKIEVIGAQKGFFVGKKFSKDAINQANKYNRLEILNFESSKFFDFKEFLEIKNSWVKNITFNTLFSPGISIPENYQFLPLKVKSLEISINDLVMKKVQDGTSSKDSNLVTINKSDTNWEFQLVYDNPIFDGFRLDRIIINVKVDFILEEPELLFDYRLLQKGHYIKIRSKDFWYNWNKKTITMEISKVGKDFKIHNLAES